MVKKRVCKDKQKCNESENDCWTDTICGLKSDAMSHGNKIYPRYNKIKG